MSSTADLPPRKRGRPAVKSKGGQVSSSYDAATADADHSPPEKSRSRDRDQQPTKKRGPGRPPRVSDTPRVGSGREKRKVVEESEEEEK